MKYRKPATLRQFCGVFLVLLLFAFAVSFAHESGLLPDFMVGNAQPQMLIMIVTGNILSQFHWERVVPNPPEHWGRLTLLVLLHSVPVYVAMAFFVHLIFKLT
ncbi:hypothetical protein ACQZ63_03450 [Agrobacterium sp. CG160-95]|jgi:hypothetical protein